MKEIRTEIVIEASPEQIWRVVTDFKTYPQWNPFITEITGEGSVRSTIRIRVRLSEKRMMTFRPKIFRFTANRELRWIGRLIVPGLFDGEHQFVLEAISPGRTRFVHCERFNGLLVPILWGMMGQDTESGFHKMNEALKQRVERLQ